MNFEESLFTKELDILFDLIDKDFKSYQYKENSEKSNNKMNSRRNSFFKKIKLAFMDLSPKDFGNRSIIYFIIFFVSLFVASADLSLEFKKILAFICLSAISLAAIYLFLLELRWTVDKFQTYETYEKNIFLEKERLKKVYNTHKYLNPITSLGWESQSSSISTRILCLDIVISRFENSIEILKSQQIFLQKASIFVALFIVFSIYLVYRLPELNILKFGEIYKVLIFLTLIIQSFYFLIGQSRIQSFQLSLSFLNNLKQIEETEKPLG